MGRVTGLEVLPDGCVAVEIVISPADMRPGFTGPSLADIGPDVRAAIRAVLDAPPIPAAPRPQPGRKPFEQHTPPRQLLSYEPPQGRPHGHPIGTGACEGCRQARPLFAYAADEAPRETDVEYDEWEVCAYPHPHSCDDDPHAAALCVRCWSASATATEAASLPREARSA